MTRQELRERTLTRPIRPHDRVDLAGADREIDAAKNLLALHRRVEIAYFEHGHPTLPSKLIPRSRWASTANSIGSSRKTSLQKPFTIIETASSPESPRCRQ